MHRDIDAADAMLARLSDLLRLTLDRVGTQEVTLKDELDFIEKYLEIERTRFGDRLQVPFVIEPDTLERVGAELPAAAARRERADATGSAQRSAAAAWRCARTTTASGCSWSCRTTAAACRRTS